MRGYVLSIWSFFDPIYFLFTRLKYLPCIGTDANIFRVRLTRYKGRSFTLSDGTKINKNDTLVKIHLHNVKLLRELKDTKNDLKKAKMIYRYVQKSLPGVEGYIRNHRRFAEIKGIIGITHLNKGCERLGFEIFDIAHPFYKWFKIFAFLPIGILSSNNKSISYLIYHQTPKYLFMSTNKLTERYGE